jgi:thiol-disulfide isomerase/thioredoxin
VRQIAVLFSNLAICGLALSGWANTAQAEFPVELGPANAEVVWVDFWASWCSPCRRSFPWMNAMHRKYADQGLRIVAVNVDKERALADEFLAGTPAEFAVHYDPPGALAARFGVQAMPSSFVLDRDGNVIASHFGFKLANREEYEQTIQAALAAAARSQSKDRE